MVETSQIADNPNMSTKNILTTLDVIIFLFPKYAWSSYGCQLRKRGPTY